MKSNIIKVNHRYRGKTEKAKFISMVNEIRFDIKHLRKKLETLEADIESDVGYLYEGLNPGHTYNTLGHIIIDGTDETFIYFDTQVLCHRLKQIEDRARYYITKLGG